MRWHVSVLRQPAATEARRERTDAKNEVIFLQSGLSVRKSCCRFPNPKWSVSRPSSSTFRLLFGAQDPALCTDKQSRWNIAIFSACPGFAPSLFLGGRLVFLTFSVQIDAASMLNFLSGQLAAADHESSNFKAVAGNRKVQWGEVACICGTSAGGNWSERGENGCQKSILFLCQYLSLSMFIWIYRCLSASICIYLYLFTSTYINLFRPRSIYIYFYLYLCLSLSIYICIYIYVYLYLCL